MFKAALQWVTTGIQRLLDSAIFKRKNVVCAIIGGPFAVIVSGLLLLAVVGLFYIPGTVWAGLGRTVQALAVGFSCVFAALAVGKLFRGLNILRHANWPLIWLISRELPAIAYEGWLITHRRKAMKKWVNRLFRAVHKEMKAAEKTLQATRKAHRQAVIAAYLRAYPLTWQKRLAYVTNYLTGVGLKVREPVLEAFHEVVGIRAITALVIVLALGNGYAMYAKMVGLPDPKTGEPLLGFFAFMFVFMLYIVSAFILYIGWAIIDDRRYPTKDERKCAVTAVSFIPAWDLALGFMGIINPTWMLLLFPLSIGAAAAILAFYYECGEGSWSDKLYRKLSGPPGQTT